MILASGFSRSAVPDAFGSTRDGKIPKVAKMLRSTSRRSSVSRLGRIRAESTRHVFSGERWSDTSAAAISARHLGANSVLPPAAARSSRSFVNGSVAVIVWPLRAVARVWRRQDVTTSPIRLTVQLAFDTAQHSRAVRDAACHGARPAQGRDTVRPMATFTTPSFGRVRVRA